MLLSKIDLTGYLNVTKPKTATQSLRPVIACLIMSYNDINTHIIYYTIQTYAIYYAII